MLGAKKSKQKLAPAFLEFRIGILQEGNSFEFGKVHEPQKLLGIGGRLVPSLESYQLRQRFLAM